MIDRFVIVGLVILLALIGVELFAVDMHAKADWQKLPAHMAIVGFAAHMVMVLSIKFIGKHFIQRPEDFDD